VVLEKVWEQLAQVKLQVLKEKKKELLMAPMKVPSLHVSQ